MPYVQGNAISILTNYVYKNIIILTAERRCSPSFLEPLFALPASVRVLWGLVLVSVRIPACATFILQSLHPKRERLDSTSLSITILSMLYHSVEIILCPAETTRLATYDRIKSKYTLPGHYRWRGPPRILLHSSAVFIETRIEVGWVRISHFQDFIRLLQWQPWQL